MLSALVERTRVFVYQSTVIKKILSIFFLNKNVDEKLITLHGLNKL